MKLCKISCSEYSKSSLSSAKLCWLGEESKGIIIFSCQAITPYILDPFFISDEIIIDIKIFFSSREHTMFLILPKRMRQFWFLFYGHTRL